MMDWLYDELGTSESAEFAKHVESCAHCTTELDSLTRTRAVFRDLPQEEPPQALTAILLHEAAKRAPAVEAAGDDKKGFGAWLAGLFKPIMMHPAAAAIASLVLVAGVAGSLYIVQGDMVSRPKAKSAGLTAAEAPAENREAAMAPTTTTATPVAQAAADEGEATIAGGVPGSAFGAGDMTKADNDPADGYVADLLGEREQKQLDTAFEAQAKKPATKGLTDGKDANFRVQGVRPEDSRSDRKPARYAAPPPPVSKPKPKEDKLRRRTKNKSKAGTKSGELANAVSGADPLLSLGDDDAEYDFSGKAEETRRAKDEPAPAPTAPAYRPYRDQRNQTREIQWAQHQEEALFAAAKKKNGCPAAARIANDILDRNPDYYTKRIKSSKPVKACSWYVKDESRKRVARRNKARSAGGGSDKGKAAAKKKQAAQPDAYSE